MTMEKLYAPWRMDYIKSTKPDGCIFCKDSIRNDELVLCENETSFVMLNRYPYVNGHLMVIPFRHVRHMEDLHHQEKLDMFDLQVVCIRVLKEALKPDGFNIGINLGKAAGAGVDDHMHIHIVPRWSGDTNFMSVVADVRVIPEDAHKTCDFLQPYFKKFFKGV
jgi:ATP adenylyltransferase